MSEIMLDLSPKKSNFCFFYAFIHNNETSTNSSTLTSGFVSLPFRVSLVMFSMFRDMILSKHVVYFITKTSLFKHIENFTSKHWKFLDINSDIFQISAQNIDCGYSLEPPLRGGSNEYLQSMFLSRNNKNNAYPSDPSFTIKKWGLSGSKLYRHVFVMT